MDLFVKNTTLGLYELICPHYCILCGEIGAVLCGRCRNYDTMGGVERCLKCGVAIRSGACNECALPFDRGWCVDYKNETLERIVREYKYESVRALCGPLTEMINEALPILPVNTIVVPMPTITRHVRERGLDHTLILARRLAKVRGHGCKRLIVRATDSVQVGADRRARVKQAKRAYKLAGKVEAGVPYLIVDDVWTTGASMYAACDLLRRNGAREVMSVVVVRA